MKVVVIPGDGIGPEIAAATQRVLEAANARFALGLAFERVEAGLVRPSRTRETIAHWGRGPMDLVIVRENTEGFYADRNMHAGSGEFMPAPDVALAVRKVTARASTWSSPPTCSATSCRTSPRSSREASGWAPRSTWATSTAWRRRSTDPRRTSRVSSSRSPSP